MRKGSIKSTRVNAECARVLAEIIREVKDPRVHPMTSVLSCDVTTDLKYAKVYVTVLADEEAKTETMEGLKKATPFIRHELARIVNLRNTPELTFIMDESIEGSMKMHKLIEEVRAHDVEVIEARGDKDEDEVEDEEDF